MEYTKQTWTAPTGTGLSRYAKSAESASHVTLTLDPVNLTNTPTPFTMARMAHMEEGIAKAYDTAPPTPWAQYSGKDIPQLPDNLAGTTYKRDNDWTTTDGWTTSILASTLSVENNVLVSTPIGSVAFNAVARPTVNEKKTVVAIIRKTIGNYKIQARASNLIYYDMVFVSQELGDGKVLLVGYIPTGYDFVRIYGDQNTAPFYLEKVYIGTGAYDRLVFDNSYHYRHLINNAVVPTPQGLYFNGATSYLRSKDKVTLPDVFTFRATVNCSIKGISQAFLAQNTYVQPTDRILIYRPPNSNELHVIGTDGTATISFTMAGYFTGLDNTDIDLKVEIDFVSKTIKAYRNGIQFGSTVSAPTIIKPSSNNIYFGNDALENNRLLGYMRNICLYDTALTDTQRNWLAQGNTPPILYDVTNYELEQGFAQVTEGVETIRRDVDFTMNTYADGKKLRIANTDDDQITCTLPSGQTMNGQTSFTIAPDTLLEFELIGTSWKCISKEWEILWENPAKASSFVSQLVTLSAVKEQFKRLVFTYGAYSGGAGYINVHTKEIQTSTTTTRLFYVSIGDGVLPQPAVQRSRDAGNITGNSLSFGEGYTTVIDNSAIIPYAIYGIK